MHEISIAQNILDIVTENVTDIENQVVKKIRLKVGSLSGVVPDSLKFCFEVISADTPLKSVELEIENIPCSINCNICNRVFTNELGLAVCPECGNTDTVLLSGTELQITDIEITDRIAD